MENNSPNQPTAANKELEFKMPEAAYSNIEPPKPSYLGIVLGALIVVLVLLVGAFYIWSHLEAEKADGTGVVRPTAEENNEPESTNAEADVETATALSTSNQIEAIEADLSNSNFETLDSELKTIDDLIENPTE